MAAIARLFRREQNPGPQADPVAAAIEAENGLALRQRAARFEEASRTEEDPADAGERDDGGRDVETGPICARYPGMCSFAVNCSLVVVVLGFIIGGMYIFAVVVFNKPNHAGFWIAGYCISGLPLSYRLYVEWVDVTVKQDPLRVNPPAESRNAMNKSLKVYGTPSYWPWFYFRDVLLPFILFSAALGVITYGSIELHRYLNPPPYCDTSLTCGHYKRIVERDGCWYNTCGPCESDNITGCICDWERSHDGNCAGHGGGGGGGAKG